MSWTRRSPLASILVATLSLAACGDAPAGDGDDCGTACEDASTGGLADDTGAGSDGADDGSGDAGEPGGPAIPCEIEAILARECGECHDDPPRYGAPMPLTEPSHFLVPATSDPTQAVYERAIDRLLDPVSPMPPGGTIEPADRDALLAWLDAGAPAVDDQGQCGGEDEPPPAVGPDALPCTPTQVFTAHAANAEDQAFHVPQQGADNLYQCFTFQSPLAEPTQATAWAPVIDDERVVHHWILYRSRTPQPDGGVGPCDMPQDATFVAGWAPGGENFLMPDDVGLELGGPDDYYILQIHYHNAAHHADALDRSGVAFCTAEQPRPLTAGIITLGSVFLDIPAGAEDHEESGVCPSWITSFMPQPLTVIANFPHMHELGRSFRTEILRGGDESQIDALVDVPIYDFQSQAFYVSDPPIQIMPGDAIRTTCTYDNPTPYDVHFGEATEDEMCFDFVMAYPIEMIGDNRSCGVLDNG